VRGLWDTNVLSRCLLSRSRMEQALDAAAHGDPPRVAAAAVLEVAYGIERAAAYDARHLGRLKLLDGLLRQGTFRVVPLDARAGVVAGRLRARCAHAPPARRGDRRSKPMRQAAWLIDIQVAATAFASGLDVVTANQRDFEQLANALGSLFPVAPALEVLPAPA
jgi:predicted nucleic acid-binding protein